MSIANKKISNHSGFYYTPRIGDEVIISYIDNDIDKPFISGSLYNTTNPILAHLPKQDHITTLSSKTIGSNEQGRNEITLSNQKDKEVITLKAQKDYVESINNNFLQTINNNKDSKVKGSYTESITKYHKQEILGLKDVRVGAEYLTNVALSKDTIVGLSHTLNVGVDNKVRIAKKSSEYVGEDKEVEIGGNLNTSIKQDESRNVGGNSVGVVEGQYHLQAKDSINMESTNETTFRTKGNLLITSNASMGLETDENATFIANNILSDVATDYTIQAGNVINLNIGESMIAASGDKIILKAGGIEVVIDSNGLVVKGGEIKSE